jgi:DNA primase
MENNRLDLRQIRENIDLVALLSQLGHSPVRRSGGELFYLSMLRESDTVPSFCVNEKMGIWFDHGLGRGGSVIDFALLYWQGLGFKASIERLLQAIDAPNYLPKEKPAQTELPMRERSYLIKESRPLSTNRAIAGYLNSRGIYQPAKAFLSELYYSVRKKDGQRAEMFAAAWQNELGGWEVRSNYFKGCLGKKALSFIPAGEDTLVVFEGMMDFLSWKQQEPQNPASALILNSIVFLEQGINRAEGFSSVELFFDHDPSGRKATDAFLQSRPDGLDRSDRYQGYKDYNEMICANIPKKENILLGLRGYKMRGKHT